MTNNKTKTYSVDLLWIRFKYPMCILHGLSQIIGKFVETLWSEVARRFFHAVLMDIFI